MDDWGEDEMIESENELKKTEQARYQGYSSEEENPGDYRLKKKGNGGVEYATRSRVGCALRTTFMELCPF